MEKLEQYPREALLYFLSEIKSLRPEYINSSRKELLGRIGAKTELNKCISEFVKSVPIFSDSKFIDCWNAAFPQDGTVCLKTSFGACAYDSSGIVIASANNKRKRMLSIILER